MSDNRLDASAGGPGAAPAGSPEAAEDLRALARVTRRDVPDVNEMARSMPRRSHSTLTNLEEYTMATMDILKRRPGLTTLAAIALAAVAMLVIPFSYQRTVGQDVALTLSGGGLGTGQVREVAKEMKALLHADAVTVNAVNLDGRTSFALTARVPERSSRQVAVTARAFAAGLTRAGYTASATVTPVRERASGTVYAYARDLVIQVSMDGKSTAQIQSELQQRLAEAGISNATVSVTNPDGDPKQLEVKVTAQHDASQPNQEFPELVLTHNGAPAAGARATVRIEKRHASDGVTLIVRVEQGDKSGVAEVPRSDTMSDEALSAAIASQLLAAGLDMTVKVSGEQIEIRPRAAK